MSISLRTYRALTRELAKTKKELSKKTLNDLVFKKMVFTAKKKYDRELKVTRDEIDIFRKSLKSWNKEFYTQKKEIKKLKSYHQKLKKKQHKKRKNGQVNV
tara:strand:+ start:9804 stop:10106 length:303 start_codon:yes stop_codon:yes gene_type:complete